MKETIETYIEKTQSNYNSRNTSEDNPKLFIIYLPTNNGKSDIATLQKAIIKFLEKHKLWSNYYLSIQILKIQVLILKPNLMIL